MTITNRETKRDALVTLLTAGMVGSGKPAQAVYGYLVGDFGGLSPVVVVASSGSEREQRAVTSRQKNTFYFTVYSFVLYAENGTDWGEDDCEDRIDLLEKTIAEIISDNRSTTNWAFLEIDGRSEVDSVLIAGSEYRREAMSLVMTVYDD